jgi:16S rRNA processing protein RimM
MQQLLEAGQIVGTHGVRGEVKVQPWADSPEFLCGFETLYVDGKPMQVISARVHKNAVLVLFEGVRDLDAAQQLKNKTVFINRDNAQLEDGAHFIADLVGLKAVDAETGEELGVIREILPLSPHNIYVIQGAREILVPAVPEFVRKIDPAAGHVLFKLIEGL